MKVVKVPGAEFQAEWVASHKEADFIAFTTEQFGMDEKKAKSLYKQAANLCKPMKPAPIEQENKAAE